MTIDSDLLLREVRRNAQSFDRRIFWRDVREIGIAAVVAPLLVAAGFTSGEWPHFLMAMVCFWIAGSMLADRRRQRKVQPVSNDPLQRCVEASLNKVIHQISLLKSVAAWYLLPLGIGFAGYLVFGSQMFIRVTRLAPEIRKAGMALVFGITILGIASVCAASLWGVYRLNQLAIRNYLEPRRQELETLLTSLRQRED